MEALLDKSREEKATEDTIKLIEEEMERLELELEESVAKTNDYLEEMANMFKNAAKTVAGKAWEKNSEYQDETPTETVKPTYGMQFFSERECGPSPELSGSENDSRVSPQDLVSGISTLTPNYEPDLDGPYDDPFEGESVPGKLATGLH
jgi:hypothetical protein